MFDLDVDLEANDAVGPSPSAPRRNSQRLMFPPCQAELKAYIGEIDESIEDTHIQYDLKSHPSA